MKLAMKQITTTHINSDTADDEPTTNGFDYCSETASLDEDDKNAIEESIKAYVRSVVELRSQDFELPEMVSLLTCPDGSKVYLIGTAHFSQESINDVVTIMSRTHPDFVVVELCGSRSQVLTMDEEKIKQDVQSLSLINVVKNYGAAHGIWQYLLMRLNAYLIDTLGMAPGGEFRAAAREGIKQPHCHIVLGDRSVGVTLRRAFDALGLWKRLKLMWTLLLDFEPITKEQVEEMKKSDFLEKIFLEMAGEHPELIRILVEERDMYLAKSIWSVTGMPYYNSLRNSEGQTLCQKDDGPIGDTQEVVRKRTSCTHVNNIQGSADEPNTCTPSHLADLDTPLTSDALIPPCCPYWPSPSILPRVVVAVVGVGHVSGIKKYWASADSINQGDLTKLLDPPLSWKVFKWSLRASLLFTLFGVGYGILRGSYRIISYSWVHFH